MLKRDSLIRNALQIVVVVVFYFGSGLVFEEALRWLTNDVLTTLTFSTLFAAIFASWLSMRIYEDIPIRELGLWWSRNSLDNFALGLAGGSGAARVALGPAAGAGARLRSCTLAGLSRALIFAFCLAAGSVGEEIFFRGYGFQLLMAAWGPWAAILPVGGIFGLMHAPTPARVQLGLPIPPDSASCSATRISQPRLLAAHWTARWMEHRIFRLFGADLSGFKIFREATGHELAWRAGAIWSGGNYGPEGGLLATVALVPLAVFLWKAPVRRQRSPLSDPAVEDASCEPASPSPPERLPRPSRRREADLPETASS